MTSHPPLPLHQRHPAMPEPKGLFEFFAHYQQPDGSWEGSLLQSSQNGITDVQREFLRTIVPAKGCVFPVWITRFGELVETLDESQ